MEYREALGYLNFIMDRFSPIGGDPKGGVTRLGYSLEEDLMHEELVNMAKEESYLIEVDEVGNTFISLKDEKEYHLVASHLDSVVNGGRFDGVTGVAIGLVLLKIIKEEGLEIPLKVGAFRCEESSNFMKSTMGSGLITGEDFDSEYRHLVSRDGISLVEEFERRGYSTNPPIIKDLKSYIELHIEQGRILESENKKIGIVNSIAGNKRLHVKIKGLAEHSGATPMDIRKDALCGAAEIVLGVENIAINDSDESAVATVGYLKNYPNSMNIVPGEVELYVDIRDVSNESMDSIADKVRILVKEIGEARKLDYEVKVVSKSAAVSLDEELTSDLVTIADELGLDYKVMASGAGHDAMKFTEICKTGLIFIPCKDGVSHNPVEYAKNEDAILGVNLILEYLKSQKQ